MLQQRAPMSMSGSSPLDLPRAAGRGSSHRGPRSATPKKPSVGSQSVAGLPLGEVGFGGGRVEDGTAWSMVARFVCSVPGCGASFTRKQNLQRHQSQKHGRPKTSMTPRTSAVADHDDDDTDDYYDDGGGMMPPYY